MFPVLFTIGGLTVTSFGVFMALAFIAAGTVGAMELKRKGENPDHAWDMAGWAAIFGILGAKLYYLVLHWDVTMANPRAAILSRSGLVWYGGFILAALAIAWRLGRLKLPVWKFADAIAPAMAVGYAVGRVGCFLVGDDYGGPTTAPWGVAFPKGAPPSTAENLREFGISVPADVAPDTVMAVHPTQLYETGMSLVIFFILWRFRDRFANDGTLFAIWVALAGVERFIVEIFRAKDDRFLGVLSVAQLISTALIVGGSVAAMRLARGTSATSARPKVARA
jgi:phosphatidylglycerol---prolipoprotein diacylglyceryl transferase